MHLSFIFKLTKGPSNSDGLFFSFPFFFFQLKTNKASWISLLKSSNS